MSGGQECARFGPLASKGSWKIERCEKERRGSNECRASNVGDTTKK